MIDFFYDSWIVILRFIIPGVFLGMIYDFFRLIRISRNDRTYSVINAIKIRFLQKSDLDNEKAQRRTSEFLIVLIEDILFFVIVAITEVLAVFHFNNGEIRIYCLSISLIGFFAYQKTLGNLMISFSKKILYLIRKTAYIIICVILTPIFFFLKQSKKLFNIHRIKKKNQIK